MTLIYSLLNKLGLKETEIDSMMEINKELRECDPENVYSNLVLVSKAGFPDDELGWLAYNNPKFLTYSKETLKNKIDDVCNEFDDFEEALKENPNAI